MAQIKPRAGIAQLVEQRTENPRVRGSSPRPGIQVNQSNNLETRAFQGCFFSELANIRSIFRYFWVSLWTELGENWGKALAVHRYFK